MKYGVFGTGTVGLSIANRLAELGHDVMMGTREPPKGGDKLKSKNTIVKVGTFSESAAFGDVLFNPTNGTGSLGTGMFNVKVMK